MRILLASIAIEGGGAERVVADLALGLAREGHEVLVAFLEGTEEIRPQLEQSGVRCVRLLPRREFASSPIADFTPRCIFRLGRLYRSFRPDLVHAHVPRATLWAAWAKRLYCRSLPFIYTEHNVAEAYPDWSRYVYRAFLSQLNYVIGVSEAASRSFISRWCWPADRITTIWNGIQTQRVNNTLDALQVRQIAGVHATQHLVLNVGNVNSRKAQEILIAAMEKVHKQDGEAICWIAGSLELEPLTADLVRRAIAELQAESYVKLLGVRRDVPNLLAACDVFVLSSRQEGFPITILEAMAAGKPVVATDVGGCAEAVVHGETGLIVPPENPAALAEAIQYILEHPDEAQRMGEAGRQRVEKHFTLEAMVRKHVEVYKKVIEQAM